MTKIIKCLNCGSILNNVDLLDLQCVNENEFMTEEDKACNCCGNRRVEVVVKKPVIYQVTCECGTFINKGDVRTAHCPMCNTLAQKFGRVNLDWELETKSFLKKEVQCTNCHKLVPFAGIEKETYFCPFCSSKRLVLTGKNKKEGPVETDTPESIRKEVEDFIAASAINVPEVKGKIIAVGSQILATIAAIPDKDIENLHEKSMEVVRAYSEVAIALMPVINTISDILKNIKK